MVVRSLEYYQFRLVREALAEREVLLDINTIRPAWLVRLGLFLYDHLGLHPSLPNSNALELRYVAARRPVRDGIRKGFTYYDCWVDDARLVAENAVNAVQLIARIMTNTTLTEAQRSIANGGLVYSTGLAKARCSYAPGP